MRKLSLKRLNAADIVAIILLILLVMSIILTNGYAPPVRQNVAIGLWLMTLGGGGCSLLYLLRNVLIGLLNRRR